MLSHGLYAHALFNPPDVSVGVVLILFDIREFFLCVAKRFSVNLLSKTGDDSAIILFPIGSAPEIPGKRKTGPPPRPEAGFKASRCLTDR